MKPTNEVELTFAQKVKIVGTMSLVTVALMASAVGYTSYQRNAKIEAAELAKTQAANVKKVMAVLPLYTTTKQFKEIAMTDIVKVPIASLPTTITAGLDPGVSPNPECSAVAPSDYQWEIKNGGSSVATVIPDGSGGHITDNQNGWEFSSDGSISIPSGASYGTYTAVYSSENTCDGGLLVYSYTFKITPPCPTGVTLTATP